MCITRDRVTEEIDLYTVLLVDDEEDVQKKLLNAVEWPEYGFENVMIAHDGLSACDILSRQHVDLMITDIRMPNMDGISLLRYVREKYPHVRCIVLSSYSDFQYAKEAILLGVENYLLKPFNIVELDYSIRKSMDNISSQKQVLHNLFLENILCRWVTGDISPDELCERAKHVHINTYLRNYCVTIVKPRNRTSINAFLSRVFSSLKTSCEVYHFVNHDGVHVSVFGGHHLHQKDIADAFTSIAKDFPQAEFDASIGSITENYDTVHQSYQSALDCLYANSLSSGQSVFVASGNVSRNLTDYHINTIIEYLKSSSEEAENSNLTMLFQGTFSGFTDWSLKELNAFNDSLIVRISLQLCSSGLINASEKESISNNIYHFEEFPPEQELFDWFNNILLLSQALMRKHTNQLSPSVLLAMQYISDNYSEYVSIKDFCNRYNMNASYLGLLFKKETGIYFKDYINQERISHAIHLIKTSKLKIMDVCKSVGFSYPSYFVLCFKKQTGLSPTQYKQMLNEKHAE